MIKFILKESKGLEAIHAQVILPHKRGPEGLYTLRIWSSKKKPVEIRGTYDVDMDSPFQKAIDSLPGPLVGGELMAGHIATVTDKFYAGAYSVLKNMLET